MPADRIAPARSATGELRSHGRYAYSPITQRPDFSWPGGKRLAVYVALNLEHYAFGEGLVEEIVPALDTHDVLNHSWREYGNRVGAWRLLDLFTKCGLPPSLLVNSDIYRPQPRARGRISRAAARRSSRTAAPTPRHRRAWPSRSSER